MTFRQSVFSVAFSIVLICPGQLQAATEDADAHLRKIAEQLRDAWVNFPTEAQKPVRDQRIMELSQTMTTDAQTLEVPSLPSIEKAFNNFLDNVEMSKTVFKLEKQKTERNSYVVAAVALCKREMMAAKDYNNPRTIYQLFDLMMNYYDVMRGRLHSFPTDIQSSAYGALTSISNEMLRQATVPQGMDHIKKYDEMTKEIKRRFPAKSEQEVKTNSYINSSLVSFARSIEQKSYAK